MAAGAPVVDLAAVEIGMSRVDTSKCRHGGRSVFALFIGAGFAEFNGVLLWEVSHIIHRDL